MSSYQFSNGLASCYGQWSDAAPNPSDYYSFVSQEQPSHPSHLSHQHPHPSRSLSNPLLPGGDRVRHPPVVDPTNGSYQFVNSLTSCYGPRPDGTPGVVPNPAEYYNSQAYANSCYGSAAAALAAGQSPSSPAYGGYLSHNGGDHHHNNHPHHSHHTASALSAYSSGGCPPQQSSRLGVSIPNKSPSTPSSSTRHSSQIVIPPQESNVIQPQIVIRPNRTTPSPSSCKNSIDSASSPSHQDVNTSNSPTALGSGDIKSNNSNNNNSNCDNDKGQTTSTPSKTYYPWMKSYSGNKA